MNEIGLEIAQCSAYIHLLLGLVRMRAFSRVGYLIIGLFLGQALSARESWYPRTSYGIDDLENLEKITEAMQRTLELFHENAAEITIDVIFGLAAAKSFLKAIPSNQHLPQVADIFTQADELIRGFEQGRGDHSKSKELIPLILNSSLWNNIVQPQRTFGDVKESYSLKLFSRLRGENYRISDNPEGKYSDMCILKIYECKIPLSCLFPKTDASEYARTHFLLFLTIIRAFPCTKDAIPAGAIESMTMELCEEMAFSNDALLSTENINIESRDLFLERIALCGLNGYKGFLRKMWLHAILKWERQYDRRCFLDKQLRKKKNDSIMGFNCHSHIKAAEFASLAFYMKGIYMMG